METNIKYETGATSHAVNDLILFTCNTRILAERIDFIYNKYAIVDPLKRKVRNSIAEMKKEFIDVLLHYAKNRYMAEFPNYEDHKHIKEISKEEQTEFANLYYADFNNWKLDHNIK